MGYLFHIHDPKFDREREREREIQGQLNQKKGAGNFRSLLVVTRGKSEDNSKVELQPVGEISSKDEYERIIQVTTAQILMTKRAPLAMMAGKANFGSQVDAVNNYAVNEIAQIQADFAETLNPHPPADGKVEFEFEDFRKLLKDPSERQSRTAIP